MGNVALWVKAAEASPANSRGDSDLSSNAGGTVWSGRAGSGGDQPGRPGPLEGSLA